MPVCKHKSHSKAVPDILLSVRHICALLLNIMIINRCHRLFTKLNVMLDYIVAVLHSVLKVNGNTLLLFYKIRNLFIRKFS